MVHMVLNPCVSYDVIFYTLNTIQSHLSNNPHLSHVSCTDDTELIYYMKLPHYPVLGQALQVNPNRQGVGIIYFLHRIPAKQIKGNVSLVILELVYPFHSEYLIKKHCYLAWWCWALQA